MNAKVDPTFPLVAVSIDKDRGSQDALKWAVNNLVSKGQTITLVHVNTKSISGGHQTDNESFYRAATDPPMKELFLPFICFCMRNDIQCEDVVIDDTDVIRAVVEFVSRSAVEKLVVGISSKSGFVRFKSVDIPNNIAKAAPDFCSVYTISKGKVSTMRSALRPAPAFSPLRDKIQNQASNWFLASKAAVQEQSSDIRSLSHESIKSPFSRVGNGGGNRKSYAEPQFSDSDISFVSSGRPSVDRMFPPRLSNESDSYDRSFEMEEMEAEMRRLKLELKQTMDMYSAACKEALTAKQKAVELHRWKAKEEQRLEEARSGEEAVRAMVERERAKCRAAVEVAEAAQKVAELEAHKRINAEKRAYEERKKPRDGTGYDIKYRRFSIEDIDQATNNFAENRKIGEGGYGPVYKSYLEHTQVSIKVLRPDVAQGRSQFQQEEICIRDCWMVGSCRAFQVLLTLLRRSREVWRPFFYQI